MPGDPEDFLIRKYKAVNKHKLGGKCRLTALRGVAPRGLLRGNEGVMHLQLPK